MHKYIRTMKIMIWIAAMFSILAGAAGPAMEPAGSAALKAHSALQQIAAQRPEELVSVIVQGMGADSLKAQAAAIQLGGRITQDLAIIKAFAVEMPAAQALTLAADPAVRWVSLNAPTQSAQAAPVVYTTWATLPGTAVANSFAAQAAMVDSALGPNDTYGYGGPVKGAFAGFSAEITPGYAITKVEVVLKGYVNVKLGAGDDPKITPYIGGVKGKTFTLNHHAYDTYIGQAKAGFVYLDITSARAWKWGDFANNLQLAIAQLKNGVKDVIYYDAIGLRVTSAPGSDATGDQAPPKLPKQAINSSKIINAYNRSVRAPEVWNQAPGYLQGQDFTVAVVDSGVIKNKDLGGRLYKNVNFNPGYHDSADRYGHGTFVATILAGDGKHSDGQYIGIAPKANLINVRVSDDQGGATEAEVVAGLQWIYQNRVKYNIRVVNLSLNSSVAQSYHTSPLDAAVEVLWFNGIVVVVSAGNNGTTTLYPPANDPFVITVGAINDMGTPALSDDQMAAFSAYGVTVDGIAKPDLVAPGVRITGMLSDNKQLTMGIAHPNNRVNDHYFSMSGTSVSAPMVSGAIAMLLQDEPTLTPDQVKFRLMTTANKAFPGYDPARAGAGYLDIYAAVQGTSTQSANTGLTASQLLWTGSEPITWGSVAWNSVAWNSVAWNSVAWNSVAWNSVAWGSDYWGP